MQNKLSNFLKTHCIGLTGGIATGKSTVATFLRELGYTVINADELSREAVMPGSLGLAKIVETFGNEVILQDKGTLDRKKLGEIIFSNAKSKTKLEKFLHPIIHELLLKKIEALGLMKEPRFWFYEAPLIIENGFYKKMKEVWVTYCPIELQLRRLTDRDKKTIELAQKILASQMPADKKTEFADVIINTDCSQEELKDAVKKILASRFFTDRHKD